MKSYCDSKINYFIQVFVKSQESENILKLIENMISSIPIILVSSDIYKLISIWEVLKSLIFPFEYPGLIIPYEPKPQLKLILSSEPFIIGLDLEAFENIKDNLDKISVQVYDLDQKEFLSNLNSSRIVWRLNNHWFIKKKKIILPCSFRLPLYEKIGVKISHLKNKDSDGWIKTINHIRELFREFFIYQILDIKNIDSIDDFKNIEKWIKKKRKHTDHKEFLASFLKTDFYSTLVNFLDPEKGRLFTEENWHVFEYLEDCRLIKVPEKLRFKNFEEIEIKCVDPKPASFTVLQQLYSNERIAWPIKQKNQDEVDNLYQYTSFPKFLNSLMIDKNVIEEIDWPGYITGIPEPPPWKDLFNPKIPYSRNNINLMIWIIWSILSYKYHDDSEKLVHVMNLLQFLLKVMTRLDRVHRKAWINFTIEVIRVFGSDKTIAENISYFIQNIDIHSKYKINWKSLNKLMIAFKHLDLGNSYNYELLASKNSQYEECKEILNDAENEEFFNLHAQLLDNEWTGSVGVEEKELGIGSPIAEHIKMKRPNNTVVEKWEGERKSPILSNEIAKFTKHKSANKNYADPQSPLNVYEEK